MTGGTVIDERKNKNKMLKMKTVKEYTTFSITQEQRHGRSSILSPWEACLK